MIPNVLSIAGTDPTSGAGIQADLKAMYALGAYGMSVITAVVAQNTQGVRRFVALEPDFVDLLQGQGQNHVFQSPRIPTRNTHGTGCSLSSAIAALLPGRNVPTAVGLAKEYLNGALAAADQLQIGLGQGPVHHFHALWPLK